MSQQQNILATNTSQKQDNVPEEIQQALDQGKPVFMMCPPNFYAIPKADPSAGHANDFAIKGYEEFKKSPNAFIHKAEKQWNNLKQTFVSLGITVCEIAAAPYCCDLVFTADSSLSLVQKKDRYYPDKSITILSHFSNEQRQAEINIASSIIDNFIPNRSIVTSYFRFEGAGDNVYDPFRDIFWSGYTAQAGKLHTASGRSDLRAHTVLSSLSGIKVVSLPVQRPFFHVDTSLAPLSYGHVLFHKHGIKPEGLKTFMKNAFAKHGMPVKEYLIPVSREDAQNLACNVVCFDKTVIVPKCSSALKKKIEKAGYDVAEVDLSCFIASGGAAHCLINDINMQRINGGHIKKTQYAWGLAICSR
ncbi:MAG: hypothetical protein PHD48_07275 [Alphaproteobacteria bacterium]|nr:hypothetical protein [Alphaproteobacteria bacterium]